MKGIDIISLLAKSHAKAHRFDVMPDGRRKGFKRARKEFLKGIQRQQSAPAEARTDTSSWQMDTFDLACPRHCDKGIDGHKLMGKDPITGDPIRLPVVCQCVKPKETVESAASGSIEFDDGQDASVGAGSGDEVTGGEEQGHIGESTGVVDVAPLEHTNQLPVEGEQPRT